MARARECGDGNERVDVCGKEWEPGSAWDVPKQGKESEPKQVEESEGERASEVEPEFAKEQERETEREQEWEQELLNERKRTEQERAQSSAGQD
jgi:hypothetical protein